MSATYTIRWHREHKGYSRSSAVREFNRQNSDHQTTERSWFSWECEGRTPLRDTRKRLATFFGVAPTDIALGVQEEAPDALVA